ncbi:uncharacterized protein B0P05DRAFT_545418 [Gilbertella persicaria]|uniref:Dolichyl-diphosphooligosaccharide-protein glycosyltransferase subunit OST5 n=1 Tax=Rhizopus stolonifer TaxID=4846 RepID=A0A367K0A7_RHIST|nr:uncharacterized protein B0P05DRAFT_545418 [Gilbertella persicaria]KAI8076674.1 hypothetical protein B0P05DRAFT_545418 [Gilbertella persicaria]RCH95682.1 hypothetical protein CU098_011279 [Rhizopus stolonifer]
MTALDDWTAGTPIGALIPTSVYPAVTLLTVSTGVFAAGTFIIQGNKTPIVQQLQTAVVASVLLGVGTIFAANAAGLYL